MCACVWVCFSKRTKPQSAQECSRLPATRFIMSDNKFKRQKNKHADGIYLDGKLNTCKVCLDHWFRINVDISKIRAKTNHSYQSRVYFVIHLSWKSAFEFVYIRKLVKVRILLERTSIEIFIFVLYETCITSLICGKNSMFHGHYYIPRSIDKNKIKKGLSSLVYSIVFVCSLNFILFKYIIW